MASASGIYAIRNVANGKAYVGSSLVIERRLEHHAKALRLGRHHSKKLQRAWAKYGEASFDFGVIEYCEPEHLLRLEQSWMDVLDSASPQGGYNVCPRAGNILGVKRSAETRAKMSAWQVGRKMGPQSPERRAYQSKILTGIKRSEEFKAKCSASAKGRPKSEAHKASLAAAGRGLKRPDEVKLRIAESMRRFRASERLARSADAQMALALDGA